MLLDFPYTVHLIWMSGVSFFNYALEVNFWCRVKIQSAVSYVKYILTTKYKLSKVNNSVSPVDSLFVFLK